MSTLYQEAVNRLLSLQNLEATWRHNNPASLRASFTRLKQLLARLEHPERNLRFIHVTGTSGKGSVTNLIHDMLLADGRSVASYTSPHTTTLLERFRVGEKLIHPNKLAQAINDVLTAHEAHVREGKQTLTFFELATCIAFVAFSMAKVEWVALEVGLGGRWDSTNIIPACDVAVITNIDLDHTEILGNTREKIAKEKSGIMKKCCKVIVGEPRRNLRAIIAKEAELKQAEVQYVKLEGDDHRLHNALIAAAAAQHVGVSAGTIEKAIARSKGLPCRFEKLQDKPLVILDGAHNEAKIATTVARIKAIQRGKLHVVIGCKSSKNAKAIITKLSSVATTIRTTRYTKGRGQPHNPAALLQYAPTKQRAGAFLFPTDALQSALTAAKAGDTVLITGSLYLAGELRTHWISEKAILRAQSSLVA